MNSQDESQSKLADASFKNKARMGKLVRELDVLCLNPEAKDMARVAYIANEIACLADIIAKHGAE